LAELPPNRWCTHDWLHDLAKRCANRSSPELIADKAVEELNSKLGTISSRESRNRGIGIHFTAYEHIQDYWIPELFLITNYSDTSYQNLHPNGVRVSREAYHTHNKEEPRQEHRVESFRLSVHNALQSGEILCYNNGDPEMFNSMMNTMINAVRIAKRRDKLRDPSDIKM
jgi:hypothetical protein